MLIHKIKNSPITSNCYILYYDSNCIIVDPGSSNNIEVYDFLKLKNLTPQYIFLTHEHFDHILGLNDLRSRYLGLKVISSLECSNSIICSKKNMSVFYKDINFSCLQADIVFKDSFELDWMGTKFYFFVTEGHSIGSICILFNNNLITGDTIILNEKTVTKLPRGSESKLKSSLLKISEKITFPINILAGHGEDFSINNKTEFLNNYLNN
jgi:glyoxylase-like metal-dependent hydrolase (beta-lactamase superfamily II)